VRADRLLSILLLLQARGRMTAPQLAEMLEVSVRTIHRDMEALGTAGVPVVGERGAGGGWSLVEGYRTNLTGLDQGEIRALFLSDPRNLLTDLGLREAADRALLKVLAAIPSIRRADAERARQRILVDVSGPLRKDPVPCLPLLHEAVWQDRRLAISYRKLDGRHIERVVDPLGLVIRGSIWYLVAASDGEPRTYRVSRVLDARILEEPSSRPEGFDLDSHWRRSYAEFRARLPVYPVVVRVAPGALARARTPWPFTRVHGELPPGADGWPRLSLRFEESWEACEYVLRFGGDIEVLEPAELREMVEQRARAALALYSRPLS
jgi:predicted DNA-binding transcriptional regulator YafY